MRTMQTTLEMPILGDQRTLEQALSDAGLKILPYGQVIEHKKNMSQAYRIGRWQKNGAWMLPHLLFVSWRNSTVSTVLLTLAAVLALALEVSEMYVLGAFAVGCLYIVVGAAYEKHTREILFASNFQKAGFSCWRRVRFDDRGARDAAVGYIPADMQDRALTALEIPRTRVYVEYVGLDPLLVAERGSAICYIGAWNTYTHLDKM